jgi:hypothetical protein
MTLNVMVNFPEIIVICATVILVTFIKYRNK